MSKSTKSKPRLRLEVATGNAVLKAYSRAAKRIQEEGIRSTSISAGFIIPASKRGEPKKGWQVFVSMEAWSELALEDVPESGGLVDRAAKILHDRAETTVAKVLAAREKKEKERRHRAYLAKRAGIKLAARRPLKLKKVGAK